MNLSEYSIHTYIRLYTGRSIYLSQGINDLVHHVRGRPISRGSPSQRSPETIGAHDYASTIGDDTSLEHNTYMHSYVHRVSQQFIRLDYVDKNIVLNYTSGQTHTGHIVTNG